MQNCCIKLHKLSLQAELREAYCLSIRVILLPEGFEEGDSAKN